MASELGRKAVAFIIIAFLVGLGVGVPVGYVAKPGPAGPARLSGEIPIGALVPLSGDFASYGARGKACLELAEEDINAYVKSIGLDVTFKFYYEDTETKPEVALEKVKSLATTKGVRVVVGLLCSADVGTIMGYCNEHKIVVITPFSTVKEYAIEDDFIFRPIPYDEICGFALAKIMNEMGITHAAILCRKDPCDLSIAAAFKDEFPEKYGGTILEYLEFDPGTTDFTTELDTLEAAIAPAVSAHGADKVGLLVTAWEDYALVLSQAHERGGVLMQIKWFGGDAVAMSTAVIRDAGEPASIVRAISPLYAATESPKLKSLIERVETKIHEKPDIYSICAYDAAWLAALAILNAGVYDGEAIRKAVPEVAKNYFGASGWTDLNEAGDRKATDLNFYAVFETTPGTYEWKIVAKWSCLTGEITWIVPKSEVMG